LNENGVIQGVLIVLVILLCVLKRQMTIINIGESRMKTNEWLILLVMIIIISIIIERNDNDCENIIIMNIINNEPISEEDQ